MLKDLCGPDARRKRLPPVIWRLSAVCKTALLEALSRGDGSNGVNKLCFTSASPTLALQVRDLWLSLGVFAALRPRRLSRLYPGSLTPIRIHGVRQSTGKRVAWNVSIHGTWLPVATSMLGMEVRRRAKTSRTGCHAIPLATHPGAWLVRVSKINRHRTNGLVYDLQVTGDSPSFVASGVAVHNCPLESLACGVPVVATACTGHSEWFRDGRPGIDAAVRVEHGPLTPIDDGPGALAPEVAPEAVAAALQEAYQRWEQLDRHAVAAAPEVARYWSWPAQLAPLIQALREPVDVSVGPGGAVTEPTGDDEP
jgi:hypothetical protein